MPDSKPAADLRPVDEYVARRLRGRRSFLRQSEESIAYKAGITLRDYRELEAGSRRISAAMLFELSMIMNVPVSFFFDGYTPGAGLNAWAAL